MRSIITLSLFFALSAQARPIELEGLAPNQHDWVWLQVTESGELLAADTHHFYHWSDEGRLLQKLAAAPKTLILAAYFDGTYYFLSTNDLVTYQYDHQGHLLAETRDPNQFIYKYLPKGDQLYCLPFTNNDTLTIAPYFFQVHELDLERVGRDLHVRTKALLGKIQPIQASMQYNMLGVWLATHGNETLLVNQLEAKIYRYSPDQVRKEQLAGTKQPTEVAAVSLDLVGYRKPPQEPFIITRPMKREAYAASRDAWWNSWSRIAWFGSHAKGYLIAYEVPDCAEPTNCASTRLDLQVLSPNFQRLGQPQSTRGRPFGLDGQSRFYVLDTRAAKPLVQVYD